MVFKECLDNSTVTCNPEFGLVAIQQNSTFSCSYCRCFSGRKGDSCDTLIQPIVGIYIFDGILYFFVMVFWMFMVYRRYKKTKGAEWEAARLNGVTPSHPKLIGSKLLLLYRFLAFGFVFGVHISLLATPGSYPESYKFYTVWNFITVIVYFGIGLALSVYSVWKGPEAIRQSTYWSTNASFHFLLLEVEYPNTLIVDVVTWAILLPTCASPCGLLSFSSFVQHLVNFFLMTGDFLLCSHAFDFYHWPFNLALPTLYAIFHLFFTISRDATFGHQPVYFFMDASTPVQPGWIFGVLIIHVVLFFNMWLISNKCLGRKLRYALHDSDSEPRIDSKALIAADVEKNNPVYASATPAAGDDPKV